MWRRKCRLSTKSVQKSSWRVRNFKKINLALYIAVNTPLAKFQMALFAQIPLRLFHETLALKFVETDDDLGQMIFGTTNMAISATMAIKDQVMDAVKSAW
jgi:hypothetical protein